MQSKCPPEKNLNAAAKPMDPTSAVLPSELLALFRLLAREPPSDHDFKTCVVCKRYGISHI